MEEVKKNKKKNKVASLLLALALILTCGVAGTIAQYQKSFGGKASATVARFEVSAGSLGDSQSTTVNLFDKNIMDLSKKGANDADGTNSYIDADVDDTTTKKIAPGTQGFCELTVTNKSDVNVEYVFNLAKLGTTHTNADSREYHDGWSVSYAEAKDLTDSSQDVTLFDDIPLKFALYVPTSANQELDENNLETSAANMNQYIAASDWKTYEEIISSANATSLKGELSMPNKATTAKPSTRKVYLCWKWDFADGDKQGNVTEQLKYINRNRLDTALGAEMAKQSSTLKPEMTITAEFTQID